MLTHRYYWRPEPGSNRHGARTEGLKIPRCVHRAGSIPARATNNIDELASIFSYFLRFPSLLGFSSLAEAPRFQRGPASLSRFVSPSITNWGFFRLPCSC